MITTPSVSSSKMTADPHLWLEDVLGKDQMAWVERCNAQCLSDIGDPKVTPCFTRILDILNSKDKIPHAYRIGNDANSLYYNFWQDADHVQGIWRKTTLDSYQSNDTHWTTVIDLDALPPSTTETAKTLTWVWHGSTLLHEGGSSASDANANDKIALIRLSPGGSDADICREFNLSTEKFIHPDYEQGYELLIPAKTRISYRSRNEVYVATDFNQDGSTLTDSGYPRIVKSWKRGTSIESATVVCEGKQSDIAANMYLSHDRGHVHEFQCRSITFYTSKYWYRSLSSIEDVNNKTANEVLIPFVEVPIPEDAEITTFANMALITLRSNFIVPSSSGSETTTFVAGSLLTLPMSELMLNEWSNVIALFSANNPQCSLLSMSDTKDYIILKILDNVCTRLEFWKFNTRDNSWTRQDNGNDDNDSNGIPVGEDVTVQSTNRDSSVDNTLWVMRDGYLVPDTMELGSAEDVCVTTQVIKSIPAMFDTTNLCVQQHFATSKDGTRIPYFVIGKTNLIPDGSNPVLLDAYGGFEISMTAGYSAGVGAGWLERGGTKVIANIRGGGEYGPAWHQAALKEKRYKCYEDVEAVAQDLVHVRKLTCPAKLACIGGSNGGLLVGNLITRPVSSTLFGAAVCQVPLLDMKRYSHLLAGASWMGEYGNPDIVDDWTYLRRHSPYHLLRHDILGMPEEEPSPSSEITNYSNWKCPRTLFTTSTRDDRVHPGHARKMVASLLGEAGVKKAPKVLYWENTEGGHGGAADNEQRAFMWALTYNFLTRELGLE